jgi:hypothetical protein
VVRGAGGPLGRFFFGAPEKLNSIAARFAGARRVFAALLGTFVFLLDFTMNAPFRSKREHQIHGFLR